VAAPFAPPPRPGLSRALVLTGLVGGALLFVGTGISLALLCFTGEQPAETPPTPRDDTEIKVVQKFSSPPAASALQPAPPPQAPVPSPEAPEPAQPVPLVKAPPQAPAPPASPAPAQDNKPAPVRDDGPPPLLIRPAAAGVGRSGSLTVAQQKQVNEAIDRGVVFLRSNQLKGGSWPNGVYEVGYAALPGLTLLECGVPPDDPAVKKAAHFVRFRAPTLNYHSTYQLSLAILFLDRLGDPKDRKLIQTLALRLITGQNSAGGWNYECPFLTSAQEQQLLKHLRKNQPKHLQEPLAKGKTKTGAPKEPLAGAPRKPLPEPVTAAGKEPGPLPEGLGGDKRGKSPDDPAAPATKLAQPLPAKAEGKVGKRPPSKVAAKAPKKVTVPPQVLPQRPDFLPPSFRNVPIVAKKGPRGMFRPMLALDDNSNTQFAIMALWAARRHYVPMEQTLALVAERFRDSQHPRGGWGYKFRGAGQTGSMTCVGLIGLAVGHGSAREAEAPGAAPGRPAAQDEALTKGLRALGGYLDRPDVRLNLYLLWCVERVGVLYNVKTIGETDWYRWGVAKLLPTQRADGSWFGDGYHGSAATLDTCMALLFLKRANLTRDLSESLRLYMAIPESEAGASKR
jgi:hypothetical protein